jgi:outer membrane protein OmpA-like peptidoglycan-associated protein
MDFFQLLMNYKQAVCFFFFGEKHQMGKTCVLLFSGLLILTGCATPEKSKQNQNLIKEIENLGLEVRVIDRGVEIILPEVLLFDYKSDRLTPEAKAKLHKIADMVNDPKVESRTIAVEGHTDSIGSLNYNLALSERRARTVGRELVFTGVRKERLSLKGFGELKPIAPNKNPDGSDNPEGRAQNRRVEIIIEN